MVPLEVDVDHRLDVVERQVKERAVAPDTGIGDDDVELSEARDGRIDRPLHRRGIAHVTCDAQGAIQSQVIPRPRHQRHARPLCHEARGHCGADSPAAARDERHATIEHAHRSPTGRRRAASVVARSGMT